MDKKPDKTPKDFLIRPLRVREYPLLEDFLYEAIFVREGCQPPRDIIKRPELQIYIRDFGKREHDHCLAAECGGVIAGAVWVRNIEGYGSIGCGTPEFAVSLYPQYRGMGMGTALMEEMLALLREKGYKQASLAVQKDNYALRMYLKLGFKIIGESKEEYIMRYRF